MCTRAQDESQSYEWAGVSKMYSYTLHQIALSLTSSDVSPLIVPGTMLGMYNIMYELLLLLLLFLLLLLLLL